MKRLPRRAIGDVQVRQPVIHLEPHRRRLQRHDLIKFSIRPRATTILHRLRNLRFMLAPSRGTASLSSKISGERAHSATTPSAIRARQSPAESGHAFISICPPSSVFAHTRDRARAFAPPSFPSNNFPRRAPAPPTHLRSQSVRFRKPLNCDAICLELPAAR